ncbi:S1 RNA-binding domain-containing protein [Odoribacter sp. Z80]|uniref:CvfB family protein n=1 Tax=Odoribacter sp. Z80 TaxID=2304575 RepID=UPI00137B22D1|nr:S1-like domain-containing RNA-binding protein [Odoribacter sp. Z80]NCE72912.1 GntR family transcriptional regulator [Odoribacter sp. Z80]
MVEIGKYNTLTVVKIVDFGVYLDGGERGEILMPKEYVPTNCSPDDEVEVFVYFDSEDRIVATTEIPAIQVGEFAFLKVVAVSKVGAFLGWGLRKDLFVPFREQRDPMVEGKSYLVYAYVDKASDRIVASTKIEKFLDQVFPDYEPGEEVEVLIARKTDLGYAVIVNHAHWGLVYDNEIFRPLKIGQKMRGYIKTVREDEKIDVSLQPAGYGKIEGLAGMILEKLKDYGGVLDLSDKSEPAEIYRVFGCSKKNYKKALGTLLKQGIIEIKDTEVCLKPED